MMELTYTNCLETVFAGHGEMAQLMRSHDWSQTPLGSVEKWSQSLRNAISILLPSKAQICLFWGSEFVALYNDAYRPMVGANHPSVLGAPARECWREIWSDVLEPVFHKVVATGESFLGKDYPFFLVRNGYLEETYFDISYNPVRDESGQVGGVFCIVSETTDRVLGERRLRTLRELAANTARANDTEEVCHLAIQTLIGNPQDVPFALLYRLDAQATQAQLVEAAGIALGTPLSPSHIDLTQDLAQDLAQSGDPWRLAQVQQTGEPTIVQELASQFTHFSSDAGSDAPHTALVIPLSSSTQNLPSREVLVLGVSPRRALDEEYRGFFDLVANNIAMRLAAGRANQETEVTFARLTQLLETMSDAFVELDRDWRITYQNAAAERINGGKPRSQVLGKTYWEEWPASVGTEMEYQYRKAMAEQVPVCFEHHYYAPPTFDVWLEIHAYPSEAGLGIFFRDITYRKQSELVTREREEILQLFFKYVPSGVAMFDRQMHYVMASQRWIEDYNLGSVESVVGRSHYDVFPEVTEQWKQVHQRALAGSTEQCEADCFEREDGSIQWVRWEIRPWYQPNQDIGGIIIFAENITERKLAEVALQKSQLQLQRQLLEIEAIYQSAPIGLNVLDTNLRFVRINQHLAEINGLSVEAHLGRTVREVLPEMADAAEPLLRSILETGEPLLNVEISGETPAQPGVQRIWLESFLPLKDGERIVGISTVCEEITDFKRNEAQRHQTEEALRRTKAELEIRVAERTLELQEANDLLHQELLQREQIEQQLRQNKARYRAIVEDQTEMIARFSPDSKVLFVNGAFCRYFGIEPDELIGKSYNPVVYEADQEKVAQAIQSMSVENPVAIVENRVINSHGEIRWTQWVNRMLFDQQGNVIEFQAVGRDITQLKQVEQALRDSEERLQLAIEASGDGIWDWNIATDDIYYSPQLFQMLGYAADELPQSSKTWQQLVHPDDMVWVQEILAAHLRDPSVRFEFDYRLRTKSGDWKWVADYGKVVAWDEVGNPVRMIGTHRDINDRKLMEAALRQSEEQRRLALDLTRIGFWDFHLPTGELTWNDNHFSLLGLSAGAAPRYEDWLDRIHPDDVEQVEQCFLASIDAHIDYEAEYRVVYPDGSEHWLMSRGQAIYDEQDQPLRSLGVVLDISDRKHMEASLQESDRRWRSLLDNVQLAVIGLDIDGNVEYANPFLLKLVGYQAEEVIGQYWFDCFLNPSHNAPVKVAFREILEHNFHSHYQNPIVTKSGEERMIAWSNTVLRSTSGQAIGTISIGEDITERCTMERMKAEFISVVSHELRTPLTSMQAALSLLSEKIIDPTSEEGEATIQIATEGTDRLVRLVNDILDLERLESGKVRLEKRICDVADLVETAIAQMQELANQAEIRLEASPYDCQIKADSDRLLQVLTNLLSNAIKFSPNRSVVQLSVRLEHPEESSSYLLFIVRDQGRGIPADNLESIFDRFHQVDASDSREKGGTGLGLAICRSIIQQHGGAIWAESTAGQGSTFHFTVPMV